MRFEHDGHSFRIRFRHEHPDGFIFAGDTRHGKVRALTSCFIEGQEMDRWAAVAQGEARCSLDDRFQKETGRKLALQRAVAHFPQVLRGTIWDAYLSRKERRILKRFSERG